jgi:hypothetical protein
MFLLDAVKISQGTLKVKLLKSFTMSGEEHACASYLLVHATLQSSITKNNYPLMTAEKPIIFSTLHSSLLLCPKAKEQVSRERIDTINLYQNFLQGD